MTTRTFAEGATMTVLGVGGIFFRAQDPDALAAWYREHLDVGAGCAAEGTEPADEWSWTVQGGPLVFAPFGADTDYWASDRQFMLNLRVSDLDGRRINRPRHGAGVPLSRHCDGNRERHCRVIRADGQVREHARAPVGKVDHRD